MMYFILYQVIFALFNISFPSRDALSKVWDTNATDAKTFAGKKKWHLLGGYVYTLLLVCACINKNIAVVALLLATGLLNRECSTIFFTTRRQNINCSFKAARPAAILFLQKYSVKMQQ